MEFSVQKDVQVKKENTVNSTPKKWIDKKLVGSYEFNQKNIHSNKLIKWTPKWLKNLKHKISTFNF